jgi:hypothetical protein
MTALATETMEERFKRLQREIREYAQGIGVKEYDKKEYDPLVALAMLAVNPGTPLNLRVQAHAEIAGYRYPKLKSMEIALPPGSDAKITIEIKHFGKQEKVIDADYTKLPTQ